MKNHIPILLLTAIVLHLMACGGSTLRNAKNIEDAREVIDDQISNWDEAYQSLCSKPRNSNLKQQFHDLHDAISSIDGCGEKCISLSYEAQLKVSHYATDALNKKSHLATLYISGDIECW